MTTTPTRPTVDLSTDEKARVARHFAERAARDGDLEDTVLDTLFWLLFLDPEQSGPRFAHLVDCVHDLRALTSGNREPAEFGHGRYDDAEQHLAQRIDQATWELLNGPARACLSCKRTRSVARWERPLAGDRLCAAHCGEADAHSTGGRWPA